MDAGLGYDGHYYGHIARRFFSMVFGQQVDSYRIQRIFPSFVIYVFMNVFGISSSFHKIILSFQIYNLILLQICAVIWCRVSSVFNFKLKYIWLGFVFWFLNFGVAEMAFYYPVLTDISALCIGFGFLYAHLKDNLILKIILTFIGGFTWPVFVFLGMILIIFPVNFKPDFSGIVFEKQKLSNRFYILLLPLPFLTFGIYKLTQYFSGNTLLELDTEIIGPTFYLSLVLNYILSVYLFSIYLPGNISIKDNASVLKKILLSIKPSAVIISVLLFLIITLIQKYLSNDNPVSGSYMLLFRHISLYSATKPLVYFVTYINYFGPVFIVFFFYLKYIVRYFAGLGIGLYMFLVIPLMTVFATEARLNIYFLPFLILMVILFLNKLNIEKKTFILFTLISFLLSKIYVPMYNVPDRIPDKMTFNNQLLFMNFHTISVNSYLFLSASVIVFSLLIVYSLRKSKNFSQLNYFFENEKLNFTRN